MRKNISVEFEVSIVMPTKNCLDYLARAIASIEAQQLQNVQLIVVNDGSTDGTDDWLRAYHGPLALCQINADVSSPALARNLGLAEASAPLVAFLDADDIWRPGKLAAQIEAHWKDPALVMSFTDYRHVGIHGDDRGTCYDYWRMRAPANGAFARLPSPASTLLGRNIVGTSTVMARRDALWAAGGFDPDLPSSEDWDLWLTLAKAGPVAWSGLVGADYLMRPGSRTSARRHRYEALKMIADRHLPRVKCHWRDRLRLAARLQIGQAEALAQEARPWAAAAHHVWGGILAGEPRAFRDSLANVLTSRTPAARSA